MSPRRPERSRFHRLPRLGLASTLALALGACSGEELTIDAMTPGSGSARGGEPVVLTGSGFEDGAKVSFGDTAASAVTFRSSTELEAQTPHRLAGPALDVTVENPDGETATLGLGFRFEPLDLSFVEAAAYYLPDLSALTVSDAAVGDFTGDGRPDLLVAAVGAPSRLLRNLGEGSFDDPYAPPETGGGGSGTGAGGAGAGGADVGGGAGASAGGAGAGGDATGGTGAGAHEPGQPTPDGSWVHDTATMLVADFDADGALDLLLCNRSGQPSRVLLGDGDGGFTEQADALPIESDECRGAALADLDGDGSLDLVLAGRGPSGSGQSYLRVLTRAAGGAGVSFEPAAELEPPASADGQACGTVQASAPEATGEYTITETEPRTGLGAGLASFDFTAGPGVVSFIHAVPATGEAPDAVELELRAEGQGTDLSLRLIDASGEQFVSALGPIDWTGWQHVRVEDPPLWTATGGNADGVIDLPIQSLAVQVAPGTGPTTGSLGVDDVRLELPAAGVVIVEDFERRDYVFSWAETIDSVTAGDLDADGSADLVLSSTQANATAHLHVILGEPPAASGGPIVLREQLGGAPAAVAEGIASTLLLDAGEDGLLDLFAVASNGQDRLLVNDGTAHFFDDTTSLLPLDHAAGVHAAMKDVDMDGQSDLLVANDQAVDRIYVRHGSSGFLDATPALPLVPHRSVRVLPFDADGDGDEDLFVLNQRGERSSLYVSVPPPETP